MHMAARAAWVAWAAWTCKSTRPTGQPASWLTGQNRKVEQATGSPANAGLSFMAGRSKLDRARSFCYGRTPWMCTGEILMQRPTPSQQLRCRLNRCGTNAVLDEGFVAEVKQFSGAKMARQHSLPFEYCARSRDSSRILELYGTGGVMQASIRKARARPDDARRCPRDSLRAALALL
jgi:hypothetical protein